MTTRFLSLMSRSVIGVNSSGSAMRLSLGAVAEGGLVGCPHTRPTPAGFRQPISAQEAATTLLTRGLQGGHGDRDGIALGGVGSRHLAGSLQLRIGSRADVCRPTAAAPRPPSGRG